MSLMDRIQDLGPYLPEAYIDFCVDGERLGGVRRDIAERLRDFPDLIKRCDAAVSLHPSLSDYASRTAAMARITQALRADGRVPGWRDEAYRIGPNFCAPPLFELERAAVPLFGFKGYGVHMNGYVRSGDELKLWVARRSLTKPTGPGKLDQIVAGGQPVGMSLKDNLIKECAEEAGLPVDLAAKARPVGAISYRTTRPEGLRDDVLFNYDLELPPEFEPRNTDGEVDAFYLWPLAQVRETLEHTDNFKFNSALVVIDFMVRHGFIDADEPDYVELIAGLHR